MISQALLEGVLVMAFSALDGAPSWIAGPNVLVFRRLENDLPNDPKLRPPSSAAEPTARIRNHAEVVSLSFEPPPERRWPRRQRAKRSFARAIRV